jgi:hypothetical protein
MPAASPGTIAWTDLTVENADDVRDFYGAVVGWKPEPVPMGDYADYAMGPPAGDPVAGICHARGPNAGLPAQWLIYLMVADLEASMAACRERGGAIISGPRDMGPSGSMCVIRDPAGAVAALIQPAG